MNLSEKIITKKDLKKGNKVILNPNQEKTLLANPFSNDDSPVQLQILSGTQIVGSVITFPLQLMIDGKLYIGYAGSTLFVNKEFRGKGLGGKLTNKRSELSPDGLTIACGLSHMSYPLFKKLGFKVFDINRFILLKKSRSVTDIYLKDLLSKIVASCLDPFLNINIKIINFKVKRALRNFQVEKVNQVPNEIEDIIKKDSHRFKECHSVEWFKWILNNRFSNRDKDHQDLFIIKKEQQIVAFFMTKVRFHEQASHRGFKNVLLGSIIEWGTIDPHIISEGQICLAGITSFTDDIDAIEICTNDSNIQSTLKRNLGIKIGNSNFAVKISKNSPIYSINEAVYEISNWRIRPAYSDNGLS